MITTTYRDIVISYNENTETWECEVADGRWSKRTELKDCKKAIDKFIDGGDKIKKKFNKFEVLRFDNYDKAKWRTLTVTSINEDGDVWVTDVKGNRNKLSEYDCKSYYLNTKGNTDIITLIKDVDAEIEQLYKKREEFRLSLAYLKPREILKQLETISD
jgi:uncharacterized protein Yka (UPF0111/DUF47 family)